MNALKEPEKTTELTVLTARLVTKRAELNGRDSLKQLEKYGILPSQFKLPQGPTRHNGQYTW